MIRRMPARQTARLPAKQDHDFVDGLSRTLPFQRREWLVQRIGWVMMGLIILAGALGLMGNGPLAKRMLANDTLQLDFEWLVRRDAQTTWKLTPRAAPTGGAYRVSLDANWAQHFEIHSIEPEPDSTHLANGRWVYEFEARDARPTPIVFHVEARKTGPLEGSVGLNDAQPLVVKQFVFP